VIVNQTFWNNVVKIRANRKYAEMNNRKYKFANTDFIKGLINPTNI
jgi:hypothetical protein